MAAAGTSWTGTGRWLRTLAAAPSLLSLSLEPDEELVCAGEEFKDYCFFCGSPTRVPRNALTGILPETVARTYSGFELAEAGHGRYYAALNSSTYSPSQYLESRW